MLLVPLAALIRVFGTGRLPDQYDVSVALAGGLWLDGLPDLCDRLCADPHRAAGRRQAGLTPRHMFQGFADVFLATPRAASLMPMARSASPRRTSSGADHRRLAGRLVSRFPEHAGRPAGIGIRHRGGAALGRPCHHIFLQSTAPVHTAPIASPPSKISVFSCVPELAGHARGGGRRPARICPPPERPKGLVWRYRCCISAS